MPTIVEAIPTTLEASAEATSPVLSAALAGLTQTPKTLPPWLFYDEAGSQLFEQITGLPEYYLTRTERDLFARHAHEILLQQPAAKTIVELGAGTATKTGILLRAALETQPDVLYQPTDVSPTALDEARENIEANIPGVTVLPQIANYVTQSIRVTREPNRSILALYIGSSIGNFSPQEARAILANLRAQLQPADELLLGTDLAPGSNKSVATLVAAYDDAAGVTAAFNRNVLTRLNRELGADFDLDCFRHQARWNAAQSRIEMHLESLAAQTVRIPGTPSIRFAAGETIHTENSYKFTPESIAALLEDSGFTPTATYNDPKQLFAVTQAEAV